ncbi:MAG: acyl carrier protein [Bacteroidota bacterium]
MVDQIAICGDISKIFSEKLNLEVPSFDTDLIGEGVLDSLMFVEFLLHLEQRFGVKISLEELEIDNFRSINAIAGFIQRCNIEGKKSRANSADLLATGKGDHGS